MSDSNEESIHISKDGVKLSYYRYVSESTPGFLFVLISIVYLKLAQFGIVSSELTNIFLKIKLSEDFKIVLIFILFIIAMPIGGLISAISYYFFGWIEVLLLKIIVRFNLFLTILPKRAYDYNKIKNNYDLNSNNFLNKGYKIQRKNEVLNNKISKIGIKANRTFARNLIFVFVYFFLLLSINLSGLNLLLSSILILLIVVFLGLICALELFVSHLNIFLADYNSNK
ncbi:hypothetical protein [Olleya sp. YS]|uniref:hypothetical protein n=1 Tax=Olleya sp. YS TaxID=3028318 RepID=UPI00243446FA|nr:hypothetical protein [Olleya sp. YS]WGD34705.1 hypothetical protein Ollyesu_13055 [Olleya sp. YS]